MQRVEQMLKSSPLAICHRTFGLRVELAKTMLFNSASTFGIEASRITDDKTQQYSYEPFDNRPQYRAFNIYYRTA